MLLAVAFPIPKTARPKRFEGGSPGDAFGAMRSSDEPGLVQRKVKSSAQKQKHRHYADKYDDQERQNATGILGVAIVGASLVAGHRPSLAR
jgi:hypothetical protein